MSQEGSNRETPDGSRRKSRHRRRIDDVFGDDLPETTSDESDEGHIGDSQEWYRAQRPPHYE
nr:MULTISPECIES: hypothetical protein [Gordonia]